MTITTLKMVISSSDDPFYNLKLEEYLLSTVGDGHYYALFYRNKPSVLLGRFQVPWREVNLNRAQENNLIVARRRSGGGCVYHDEGNLNFCFVAPKNIYDKDLHFNLLLNPFRKAGLNLVIGDKDDLLLQEKKVTGSAFRHARTSSYHHGTLLFSAKLSDLKGVLRPMEPGWETKAVGSRRAAVMNITEVNPGYSLDRFLQEVELELSKFCENENLNFAKLVDPKFSVEEQFEFADLSWIYGECPVFTRSLPLFDGTIELKVEKGRVKKLLFNNSVIPLAIVDELEKLLRKELFLATHLQDCFQKLKQNYPEFESELLDFKNGLIKGCF